jgi:hypothetical protein
MSIYTLTPLTTTHHNIESMFELANPTQPYRMLYKTYHSVDKSCRQFKTVQYVLHVGQIVLNQFKFKDDPKRKNPIVSPCVLVGIDKSKGYSQALLLDALRGLSICPLSSVTHMPSVENLKKYWFTNDKDMRMFKDQLSMLEVFWGYLMVSKKYKQMHKINRVWPKVWVKTHLLHKVGEKLKMNLEEVLDYLADVDFADEEVMIFIYFFI